MYVQYTSCVPGVVNIILSETQLPKFSYKVDIQRFFLKCRSSHRECSVKIGVLKNFAIFRGKQLCWSPTQVLSCEYCEIFKNTYFEEKTYFEEHLRTTASKIGCSGNLIFRKTPVANGQIHYTKNEFSYYGIL